MSQRSRNHKRATLAAAVMAVAVLGPSGSAMGSGTGQHDVARLEDAKSTITDVIEIKTTGTAEVTTGHVTIGPGGHTAWHHHPGPHIVTVKAGTVEIYETDCTFKTYTAGQGFYDPGHTDHPHVHAARNPDPSVTVDLAITDIREVDKRLTVVPDPQPASCFATAAPISSALPAATRPIAAVALPKTS